MASLAATGRRDIEKPRGRGEVSEISISNGCGSLNATRSVVHLQEIRVNDCATGRVDEGRNRDSGTREWRDTGFYIGFGNMAHTIRRRVMYLHVKSKNTDSEEHGSPKIKELVNSANRRRDGGFEGCFQGGKNRAGGSGRRTPRTRSGHTERTCMVEPTGSEHDVSVALPYNCAP